MEVEKQYISYDKKSNRIVIDYLGETLYISPEFLRDFLPTKTEEEKVKEIAMMIHEIEKEKFTQMKFFILKMREIEEGLTKARKKLEKCPKMVCVKKWTAIIKSYVDEKNVLAEIRRTIGIIERRKPALRARIARLGFDPTEATGETGKKMR